MTDYDEDDVANGLHAVARAIQWLGNGDAATHMGGLEALGKAHLDIGEQNAGAISDLAEAVRDAGSEIGEGLKALAAAIRPANP